MIFEFKDPIQYNDEGNHIYPGDKDFVPENPWNFSRIEMIEAGDPTYGMGELIEYEEFAFYYKHEATAGEILVASLLLVVIIFLFIDLVLQRLLPRFMRFWK